MRVALVHPFFWPEVRRGAERVAHELSHGLLARAHEVVLLTSHPEARRAETTEDGLRIVRVRRRDASLAPFGLPDPIGHLPGIVREIRTERPDVALALMPLDALAARAAGVPTVFAAMGVPVRAAASDAGLAMRAQGLAARRCSAATALSSAAAAGFRELHRAETRVIGAPVDIEAFRPDPDSRSAVPTIVFAGSPDEPRKRLRTMVHALGLVRETRPDARLIVDRPRQAHLRDLLDAVPGVEQRDLSDHVALLGAYREAWVSALPAVGEAFGLVLAEALACGTPVVARRDGGMPEVLGGDERCGRLFSGEDPAALARATREALELQGSAEACRARALAFSTARCAADYEALFEQILSVR